MKFIKLIVIFIVLVVVFVFVVCDDKNENKIIVKFVVEKIFVNCVSCFL